MIALSNQTLHRLPAHVRVPAYDRAAITPGIVHFGVGNFHRTHMALHVDECLAKDPTWAITGVGLQPGGAAKAQAFRAQDGLYTVTEYAPDGGTLSRVVGAMTAYLDAQEDPEAVIAAVAAPGTRILSFTITEGGYNLNEVTGAFDPALLPPINVFGLVVEGMQRRRLAGLPGVTLMSCDNLRSNGNVTAKAFLAHARHSDPETAAWMEAHCTFPNSMVDRIAPTVGPAEAARANQASGIADRLPAIAEDFTQWVMEDKFANGRPDFAASGVQLRPDVHAFEAIKGRMLNAGHMIMSFPSVLMGYRIVDHALRDPRILGLMTHFLNHIAIPLITPPSDVSLTDYRDMIVRRFSNAQTGDQLLRICGDGCSKMPIFLSATTRETLGRGADPTLLAWQLACVRGYLLGRDDSGAAFDVFEPKLTPNDWTLVRGAPDQMLHAAPFAALHLWEHEGYRAAYLKAAALIAEKGAGGAFAEMIAPLLQRPE